MNLSLTVPIKRTVVRLNVKLNLFQSTQHPGFQDKAGGLPQIR